jgi:small subunit ribosomal protein S5
MIFKQFLLLLYLQKTHQMLAEEKKLHVVELRKENDFFPTVVASPPVCRKQSEVKSNEIMDYTQVT